MHEPGINSYLQRIDPSSDNMKHLFYTILLLFMGIGDWGLGIGDWAQSPIPNPQSPIPNPQIR